MMKVAVVDATDCDEFGFDRFRRTLARRLHLLEPLRYQLAEIPGKLHHPMWLENCDVDLDYHVRRMQIKPPGGRREFDAAIGEVASTPLDRSRPLWEFHFVEGMPDNRFAIIGKVHHALADGVASANLMALALDLPGAAQSEKDGFGHAARQTARVRRGFSVRGSRSRVLGARLSLDLAGRSHRGNGSSTR